jgi:hypothetical protein
LSCVADSSRPHLASYLPALYLLGTGHTCSSTHAFASGFLQPLHYCNRPCLQLSFASVRLDMDFDRYQCHNTGQHHLVAGPCPAHIGIGPPLTGRPSHTTVRTGPYTAVRPVRQNRSPTGLQLPFCRAFGKHDAMGISATAAICPRVHNSYLPLPFTPAIRQAAPFGPSAG